MSICAARGDGGEHLPRFGTDLIVRCSYCDTRWTQLPEGIAEAVADAQRVLKIEPRRNDQRNVVTLDRGVVEALLIAATERPKLERHSGPHAHDAEARIARVLMPDGGIVATGPYTISAFMVRTDVAKARQYSDRQQRAELAGLLLDHLGWPL